jgi:transcription elongation factor GreA
MTEKIQLTKDGVQKLEQELKQLVDVKRADLKETIEEMRKRGDLSENDGYTLALEQFEANEKRIAEIQDMLESAEIVAISKKDGVVTLGSKVTIENNGTKSIFTIVGDSEADPLQNKVSIKSPIGSALIDRKVGEVVSIELPKGTTDYKIVAID